MFGSQSKPTGGFSFGAPATTTAQSSSLFGNNTGTSGFSFGSQQQQQQPQQQANSVFGQQNTQPSTVFGQTQPQQPQQSSLFGTATQKPGGIFGTGSNVTNTQPQQSNGSFSSLFSQPQQQQQQQQPVSIFGNRQLGSALPPFGQTQQQQQVQQSVQQQQQAQRPLDQTLRFGQSQQGPQDVQNGAQPLWEEGRGLGVYRSIPAQMSIIKDKWDPAVLTSPLRAYLYQHVVDEGEALRYRPGPDEDENRWEEAVQKRPGPTWVPLQVRGFFELGKKAQLQMEAIQRCNMMLQEINSSLNDQLDIHRQKVSTRLAECKRRHQAASQRILALAVKVQILRNRGYVMDNAEEELKAKLEKLEREILDPSLNAREQEIWARMLGIRERAKRLKTEMDKIAPVANDEQPLLDEETVKAAKKTLDAYDTQLRHLQKELQLVQQEFNDWEKLAEGSREDRPRRR